MNLPVQHRAPAGAALKPLVAAIRATLRPYQRQAKDDIYDAWARGFINVLAVLPTGAGKTVTFSDILREHQGASCAIAHRQELVGQISLALARDGVRHRIIGPKSVVKLCVNQHMAELGVSYYDPRARCAVAGVDTLIKRNGVGKEGDFYYQTTDSGAIEWGPRTAGKWAKSGRVEKAPANCLRGAAPPAEPDPATRQWAQSVTLWVQDEAHHVLRANKWGTAAAMFPNARGLGVTATPTRADGKGLGRHADGLFDTMVEGPDMRELIDAGYLTDYRIFAPPSDLDLSAVSVGASGDYVKGKLKTAVRSSHIMGDIVAHYLRIAPGKRGVTFVSDVETATDVAARFNAAGVPAEVVHAKTSDADRISAVRRLKNRELLQLVNVDLFGEGFDLPAIEVVIMARPTQSFGLYVQQFGRVLRLMLDPALYPHWDRYSDAERRAHIAASTKPRGIIIDHVGNVERHGLPDARREWSLDRREKRSSGRSAGVIPTWTCAECSGVWESIYKRCQAPECDAPRPEPSARNAPEFVDGDLFELDPDTLAAMRGEVERVDMHPEAYREELAAKRTPHIGQMAHVKRHAERQEAQTALRESIAWWAGYQRAYARPDSESYRRFYFAFGVDVMTAQALNAREAIELAARINEHLGGVRYATA